VKPDLTKKAITSKTDGLVTRRACEKHALTIARCFKVIGSARSIILVRYLSSGSALFYLAPSWEY
jgi:hypothetical protein